MNSNNNIQQSNNLDKAGIICSAACAIHCALFPVLAMMLPSFASFFQNEWIHLTLLGFIVPIALISFVHQKRTHKKSLPMLLGGIGCGLLVLAIVGEQFIEVENFERIVTILGSAFLIMGHFFNIKFMSQYRCKA